MYDMDRAFIDTQVRRVLANWDVTPSGPGSGVGDVAYWIGVVQGNKGWEPYWEDRIGQECAKSGYTLHPVPPPVLVPPIDVPPVLPTPDLPGLVAELVTMRGELTAIKNALVEWQDQLVKQSTVLLTVRDVQAKGLAIPYLGTAKPPA